MPPTAFCSLPRPGFAIAPIRMRAPFVGRSVRIDHALGRCRRFGRTMHGQRKIVRGQGSDVRRNENETYTKESSSFGMVVLRMSSSIGTTFAAEAVRQPS